MQSFIHRKNLENFRKKLSETTDKGERREIKKLLAAEEAKEPPPPERAPRQPKEI